MNERKKEVCFLIMALGLWLAAFPWTFGLTSQAMIWSDHLSGIALICLGFLSLSPNRIWSDWSILFVGLWLQFAPLVFWAQESSAYANDTLIGVLAMALSFLLPVHKPPKEEGSDIPPGWSYNPSSWTQRIATIGLAMVCWFFSRYLAAYQLGYIHTMWDPFFGDGTIRVITSQISHDFPVSDAGLGALGYTLEFLMGWQGDKRRWHTMPWMVIVFGIFVVPVSFISILLIILQPVAVGAWCFLCLFTAVCMLVMIVFTVAEVVAAAQFLHRGCRQGKPFWQTLWEGGERGKEPALPSSGSSLIRGATFPWNLLLSAAIGVWLLFGPTLYGTQGGAANSDYIAGPLLVSFSVVSLAEVLRAVRFFNILLGMWLIVSPWVLEGGSDLSFWNNILCGIFIILLALPRGKVRERYGSWDRWIV